MKHTMMKKVVAGIMSVALIAGLATGCSNGQTATSEDAVTVGVIQYATHPSLDNCYEGFKQGLEEAGFVEGENLVLDFQNGQNDAGTVDMAAKNMVSKQEDMVVGIATPAAMSAYAAAKDTDIPVVFTAVNDPVASQIVQSLETPGTNCTGTSDVLPLEDQIKMIRAFLPDADTIGILYTNSESNSISNLEKFEELAPQYGFKVEAMGVTSANEVASGAQALVAKGVDCINNFTDNNVVDNLSSVLQAANEAGIPVFGSEIEQVKNGCLASMSIDYVALGRQTGQMAAQILKGEANASDMAVQQITESSPVYNSQVMQTLGLSLPADYSNAEDQAKA